MRRAEVEKCRYCVFFKAGAHKVIDDMGNEEEYDGKCVWKDRKLMLTNYSFVCDDWKASSTIEKKITEE